jgi:hypothetical protein
MSQRERTTEGTVLYHIQWVMIAVIVIGIVMLFVSM